jgi:Golgin subfamily A member 7/ERF4 family
MESINAINEILISAYSLWHSVFDNGVEIFSLQLSKLVVSTHYERVIIFASDRVNRGFTLLFFFFRR